MITAIDTNVFLDILIPNEQFSERSAHAIEMSATAGALAICDVVYAELCIHFATRKDCDAFLDATDIRVESLTRESLFAASRAWHNYRRRGGRRARILPDFLIGAHAQNQASRLLSRDRGFYRMLFPALEVIDPAV